MSSPTELGPVKQQYFRMYTYFRNIFTCSHIHTYIRILYVYVCMYACMYVCMYVCMYRIAQNSGGVKLWRISNYKVLARKTLANLQYLNV